jgi:hypothetical protein
MAFDDDRITYGFNRTDAEALAKSIGGGDFEFAERKPRGGGGGARVFLTGGSGIPARSGTTLGSATCTRYLATGGTLTASTTQTVYNLAGSAIAENSYIIAVLVENVWIAVMEDCS